ncbi:MAG: hypothetical protein ABRQ37_19770 [Candidatus Eremiobacterota bacterium]
MKKMTEKKGMVIISILMVTVVLLIMTTSMLIIHSSTLGFITTFEKQTMARKLAESGVAYALYSLKNDSTWGDPNDPNCHLITVPVPEVNGKFEIAFNRSSSFYSFNNIMNGADPNGGYNNSGVPGYSVDLIVTGIVDPGSSQVSKKYRVILQADSYYDGAVTSGAFIADANSVTVKTEGDDPNIFLPGSIHSNSVLGVIDPNTGLPISKSIKGTNHSYAIDPAVSTKFDLYGGVLSAQGDINPSVTLTDPNSQIESKSRARHMKPVDISGIINDAKASTTIQKASESGKTYVVGKDSLVNPSDANSSVTISGVDPNAYSVSNGQLNIKKDIVFSGNTKFEFAYSKITEGITDTDTQKSTVKNAGIYMEKDPNGNVPSVYVDGGDLTVAGGIVKGNGSFYVDGAANYIGENNLTASEDPGVAVLANKDVNLSLPCVSGDALNVKMKGLVYSSGNANIERFDPTDTTCKTNLTDLSSSAQWPPSWTWNYEEVLESGGGGGGTAWQNIVIGGGTAAENPCPMGTQIGGSTGDWYKCVIEGDGNDSNVVFSDPNLPGLSNATLKVGSTSTAKVILYKRPNGSNYADPNSWIADNTINLTSGQQLLFSPTSPSGWPTGLAASFKTGLCKQKIPKSDPVTHVYQIPLSQSAPGFNFTGALVAIDPNNPVPSVDKRDDPNAGNIRINIGSDSKINITCSSKYLKLLRVIKAGTVFRVVSWTEI